MTEKLMYASRAGIHYDTAEEAEQADEREKTQKFIDALGIWENNLREGSQQRQVPLPDLSVLQARLAIIHADVMESLAPAGKTP